MALKEDGRPFGKGKRLSEMTWKAGIIGCGKIAGIKDTPKAQGHVSTHAQAYHRHPKFQLVAAMNPEQEIVSQFQKIWNIENGFQSLSSLLQDVTLDIISICSPNHVHFQQIKEILEAAQLPRIIFIEKPLCTDSKELLSIQRFSAETGVPVIVNHSRRFDPAHQKVADMIRSNRFGDLVKGRCVYYGGWVHNGVHQVDTVRMLFDQQPIVLNARLADTEKANDPNLEVSLAVGDSARIFFESFKEELYQLFESEFLFEKGRVRLSDFGNIIFLEKVHVNSLGERELIPMKISPLKGLQSPLYQAIDTFDKYLNGDSDAFSGLGVDLLSAASTMQILWQAKEQAFA